MPRLRTKRFRYLFLTFPRCSSAARRRYTLKLAADYPFMQQFTAARQRLQAFAAA